jgi:prevent-host-death family protein
MKVAPLYEVKNKLSEYVKETVVGPIVITKNGKPCAALVHLEEDQDMESFLLSHNPRFLHLLDDAHRKTQEKGGTPLSDLMDALKKPTRPRRKKKSKS